MILEKLPHGSVLSPVEVSLLSDQVIPPRSFRDILFSPFVDKIAHINDLLGASVATAVLRWFVPVLCRFSGPVRECRDSLHGCKLFTTLDLYSGYWQIPIAKNHCLKTASSTESGHLAVLRYAL